MGRTGAEHQTRQTPYRHSYWFPLRHTRHRQERPFVDFRRIVRVQQRTKHREDRVGQDLRVELLRGRGKLTDHLIHQPVG